MKISKVLYVKPAISLLFHIMIVLLLSDIAFAHAILVESVPKDGAVLAAAPSEVELRFNARIEKKVSQLTLLDGENHKLALPEQTAESGGPDRLVVRLPRLRPGSYRLEYLVLATDGHATPGLVRFTVSGDKHR